MKATDPKKDPRFKDFDDFSGDSWFAPAQSLRQLRASALLDFRRSTDLDIGSILTLGFSEVDPEYFKGDESPSDPSTFEISARSVRFRAVCPIDTEDYVDSGVAPWIRRAASRLAKRHLLRLESGDTEWSGGAAWAMLEFAVPRHVHLRAVLDFNDQLRNLVEHRPENLDEDGVWDLLRSGLPHGLIGCPESDWFEAKRTAYELDQVLGEFELAKDLSAIANSGGGILVIGLRTISKDGIDVVSELTPVPHQDLRRYRSVLRARLYPQLRGLEFAVSVVQGQLGVLGIRVRRQPLSSLPVLVVGMPGFRGHRLEGAYWGLFRRIADQVTPINAQTIHSALRGGVL
jgi:hypothetical protein